jgi:hypothetical protein
VPAWIASFDFSLASAGNSTMRSLRFGQRSRGAEAPFRGDKKIENSSQ